MKINLAIVAILSAAGVVFAQDLPVKRIALFSSGVGYFQRGGTVNGAASVSLPFDLNAVNDALKSLTVSDTAAGASPVVSYPSEETLSRTLQSLGIDLSGNPGTAEIFAAQRGAEIEVSAPNPVQGRIVGVEQRAVSVQGTIAYEKSLSLNTADGIKIIALRDIASFRFTDPALNADLKRALDLIAANRASRTRNLTVTFNSPGGGSRNVELSYVIPTPVWKVSYRLDLAQARPLFQGWAIIDNGSDSDWNNVELSLVSGRPVSFIQELYPPYYLSRPVKPLAIAGIAEARTYDTGYDREAALADSAYMAEEYPLPSAANTAMKSMSAAGAARSPAPAPYAPVEAAASGGAAGDQFAFTVNKPVTLPRRQSAMIPLVNANIAAEKTLILSGAKALGGNVHPELAAELTNSTGMKLPAGPITVYDGGSYAGDALIEFWSENDKRFISYGEDLSVTANAVYNNNRFVSAVTVSGGVMTINRRVEYRRDYTIKNAGSEAKKLIIEHPVTGGAELTEPSKYLEKTAAAYRFAQNLPAAGEITFSVKEESPLAERVVLGQLRPETLLSYSTNGEIPAAVRSALARAVDLQKAVTNAQQVLTNAQNLKNRFTADQERVRANLAAAGSESELGRSYLKRMTALDADIDKADADIDAAEKQVQQAKAALDSYIAGLKL